MRCGRRDESADKTWIVLGFEKALTQMDEVTLGLLLAPAPPIGVVDAQVGKRRRSRRLRRDRR